MYLQKEISIKIFCVGVLKVTTKRAESGSGSRAGAGSVGQRYGFEDPDPPPDPYQNVKDPEYCIRHIEI
jgi:hypothetical protein